MQYSALPGNLTEDLAYHFCLMNPNFTTTQFRSILDQSLVRHSPNFSWDLRKRAGFRFFGATHYDFWYHTIFNTDATTGGTPVNPYVGTRYYSFTNAPRPANPIQIEREKIPKIRKSVRHNLVESNPLSMATPDPRIEFTGLPASVKDTSQTNENLMPVYTHTAPKANVNVDGFGKLWRAYWSVFAAGGWTSPQPMRRSAAWATEASAMLSGSRPAMWVALGTAFRMAWRFGCSSSTTSSMCPR